METPSISTVKPEAVEDAISSTADISKPQPQPPSHEVDSSLVAVSSDGGVVVVSEIPSDDGLDHERNIGEDRDHPVETDDELKQKIIRQARSLCSLLFCPWTLVCCKIIVFNLCFCFCGRWSTTLVTRICLLTSFFSMLWRRTRKALVSIHLLWLWHVDNWKFETLWHCLICSWLKKTHFNRRYCNWWTRMCTWGRVPSGDGMYDRSWLKIKLLIKVSLFYWNNF